MRALGPFGFVPLATVGVVIACGDHQASFSAAEDAGSRVDDAGPPPGHFGDSTRGPCTGLQCRQVDCASQGEPDTTVSGIVYDPAGSHPLFNVIVYVPNDAVKPLEPGAVCDQCGAIASGSPVVSALTGPDGRFVLHNVPAGDAIPLVLQLGKWRRQAVIAHVSACADTSIIDRGTMRLPASRSEGDMPQIAIATGGCDPFECLLRKIGIADSEFTNDGGDGRVHVYQGVGGSGLPAGTTPAATLWASSSLGKYDMIINACECAEQAQEKPQSSIDNLVAYANAGGRLFNTHYHYYWIDPTKVSSPVARNPAWQSTAVFIPEQSGTTSITGFVDATFPKGDAFAHWLLDVGASTNLDRFPIEQARYNVTAVRPPSLRWISDPDIGDTETMSPALLHYTFNTPVGAPPDQQCGKVLFSDFHVVSPVMSAPAFPTECDASSMTPQELALEFMLFDLSACIQEDTQPPPTPPHLQ
jgi:hypothetical protein